MPKSPSTSEKRSLKRKLLGFLTLVAGMVAGTSLSAQSLSLSETPPNAPRLDPTIVERDAYAALDDFAGVWKGTLILSNENGDIIRLVPINQNYWWEGRTLKGLATYGNDTRIDYAFSDTSVERGMITSIIKEGTRSKIMEATPTDDGLVWTPKDPTRLGAEQSIEQITVVDGQNVMVIQGFERINNLPLEQRILIYAELIRQEDAEASEDSE